MKTARALRLPALLLLLLPPWLSLAQTSTVTSTVTSPVTSGSAPVSTPVFADVPQETLALDTPAFPLFDPKFYDNQLFLLGEAHGVQRPQALALLQHLNQRAGVRTYVTEVDCAKAYYLNEYLRTGHEATLSLVFRSWQQENSQWANRDLRAKFQQIRAWNLTLLQRRKVRFLGLDQLQDLPLAADYLNALMHNKKLPLALRAQLDSVATRLRLPARPVLLAGVAQRAAQELTRQAATCGPRLGRAYDALLLLLTNASYSRAGILEREQHIFDNFRALYRTQRLEGEKLYGLWGLAHVLQSPLQSGATLFAGLVRQSDLPLRNKVASVLCVFADCRMLLPTAFLPPVLQAQGQPFTVTDRFNHNGPLTVLDGMAELMQRTAPGSATLFKLDAPAAATTRQPIRVRYAPGIPPGQQIQFAPQLPASAYVQYLLLVRDSGPVQPLAPTAAVTAAGK